LGAAFESMRSFEGVDVTWMDDSLCRKEGVPRDYFFAEWGRKVDDALACMEAKAVCMRCDVQARCLAYALEVGEVGIWGGTTTEERSYFRKHGRFPAPRPLRKIIVR
jgi:WhiB family redox-sensing transcriptional regulator